MSFKDPRERGSEKESAFPLFLVLFSRKHTLLSELASLHNLQCKTIFETTHNTNWNKILYMISLTWFTMYCSWIVTKIINFHWPSRKLRWVKWPCCPRESGDFHVLICYVDVLKIEVHRSELDVVNPTSPMSDLRHRRMSDLRHLDVGLRKYSGYIKVY